MKLRYTASAQRRLRRLIDREGVKLGRRILDRADELLINPHLGPVEENLEHLEEGYRFLLVTKYYKLIYYLEGAQLIVITDIFPTRDNPANMKR